jgi:hypothetical protein
MHARSIAVLTLAAALIAPAAIAAPSKFDTYYRYRVDNTKAPPELAGKQTRVTANLTVRATWQKLAGGTKGPLKLRSGAVGCVYTITFDTALVVGSADSTADPVERVTERVPGSGPYVLDRGTRGRAAWRVVRIRRSDQRVQVRALRVDPVSTANAGLQPGQKLWRETTATAISRPGDECHSGTYRNGVGPMIGDALATSTGRGYAFTPR